MGTRGSLLARAQSQQVAERLMQTHPGLRVDVVICTTTGDRITDRPLSEGGGKGLFTKELEEALLHKEIDFAVHSFKDMPVTMPLVAQDDLTIAAVPAREDARDVLVTRDGTTLDRLPRGANVGSSSMRRRAQLLAMRDDLSIPPVRGNIDTRLRKVRDGEYDAIVLAAAGLKRAGLFDESTMRPFEPSQMLPAAGQGALALQCRRSDAATVQLLNALEDPVTKTCTDFERSIVLGLGGDCHSPIAAYAVRDLETDEFHLRAVVGTRNGELPIFRADSRGHDVHAIAQDVLRNLLWQGAHEALAKT